MAYATLKGYLINEQKEEESIRVLQRNRTGCVHGKCVCVCARVRGYACMVCVCMVHVCVCVVCV